jgi:hypothetical protein
MNDGLNLIQMARELLAIHEDFPYHTKHPEWARSCNYELRTFEQTWGSTSLGFGGIGGSAMTTARTYVLIPNGSVEGEHCLVYFAGRFAYAVPYSQMFVDDVCKERVAAKWEIGKYIEAAKGGEESHGK